MGSQPHMPTIEDQVGITMTMGCGFFLHTDLVTCYTEEKCAGNSNMMSSRQCCVENPDGKSFQSLGQCHDCFGMCSMHTYTLCYNTSLCIHNIKSNKIIAILVLLHVFTSTQFNK